MSPPLSAFGSNVLLALTTLLPVVHSAEPPITSHVEDLSTAGFVKQMDVFGVILAALPSVPDAALWHAASVLAKYIDNDEDGIPDDSPTVEALKDVGSTVLMSDSQDSLDELFDEGKLDDLVNNRGGPENADSWAQILFADEVGYGECPDGGSECAGMERDASLEELLHIFTDKGLANAYPEKYGLSKDSELAIAIDAVIGDCEHRSECFIPHETCISNVGEDSCGSLDKNGVEACENPEFGRDQCLAVGCCAWGGDDPDGKPTCIHYNEYEGGEGFWITDSCTGTFHYADDTCDFEKCLLPEGIYWGLMAMFGGLSDQCEKIANEWELCTEEAMTSNPDAAALVELIRSSSAPKMPTVLPNGTYNWSVYNKSDVVPADEPADPSVAGWS